VHRLADGRKRLARPQEKMHKTRVLADPIEAGSVDATWGIYIYTYTLHLHACARRARTCHHGGGGTPVGAAMSPLDLEQPCALCAVRSGELQSVTLVSTVRFRSG
jgi:hypothetical protein